MNQTEQEAEFIEANILLEREQYEEAAALYKKLAENGHAEAQSELGQLYLYGLGVKKDEDKAIEWFAKAADQGYLPGERWLNGTLNKKKERESQDPDEVILAYSYTFDLTFGNGGKAEEEISALAAKFPAFGIKCKGEYNKHELQRGFYKLYIYLPRKMTSDYELFDKIHTICKENGAD